ncbi:uncharacterized protein WM277_013172 isoform 1-T1 [Molossus nigricans]
MKLSHWKDYTSSCLLTSVIIYSNRPLDLISLISVFTHSPKVLTEIKKSFGGGNPRRTFSPTSKPPLLCMQTALQTSKVKRTYVPRAAKTLPRHGHHSLPGRANGKASTFWPFSQGELDCKPGYQGLNKPILTPGKAAPLISSRAGPWNINPGDRLPQPSSSTVGKTDQHRELNFCSLSAAHGADSSLPHGFGICDVPFEMCDRKF